MSENVRHNKNNSQQYQAFLAKKKRMQRLNTQELRAKRIQDNLEVWDKEYSKIGETPTIKKEVADSLRANHPVRSAFVTQDVKENYRKAYTLARYYIAMGISPSSVFITNLNECYLSVRGFGDQALIKEAIFSSKVKLLIIEELRENRNTDVKDNASTFVNELASAMALRNDLIVLFIGNSENSYKFFDIKYNENFKFLSELDITVVTGQKPRKKKNLTNNETLRNILNSKEF